MQVRCVGTRHDTAADPCQRFALITTYAARLDAGQMTKINSYNMLSDPILPAPRTVRRANTACQPFVSNKPVFFITYVFLLLLNSSLSCTISDLAVPNSLSIFCLFKRGTSVYCHSTIYVTAKALSLNFPRNLVSI